MQKINSFSLQTHTGEYKTWPLETQLYLNENPTKTYLPGFQLLHQFELSAGEFLLITDWDCPFEEATEVLLLSADLQLLDRHKFGAPYDSYCLDKVEVIDDANIKLTIYQDIQYLVTINAHKALLTGKRLQITRL
jgi:hypothetical protein